MKPEIKNIAYIDGANLHRGVLDLGWRLDYERFRVWLREKYGVKTAYLFIGLVPKHKDLYARLQKAGYILIFKETIVDGDGIPKGNCDAELVLQATRDVFESDYGAAVLVSSDGDYACLAKFLLERHKLLAILSPRNKCSLLLKRTNARITFLNEFRHIISQKEKAPDADRTA